MKRLRGLRLCPEGAEDRITHLVVDKERRTLKVSPAALDPLHTSNLGSHCLACAVRAL